MEKRHILICGERQVGKTTLIKRLLEHWDGPVCGFVTKMWPADERGFHPIYMFAPDDEAALRRDENHIGNCSGKERTINISTFDNLGVELLKKQSGLAVMDELGFFEVGSPEFCAGVFRHLDSEGHVLAAVKSNIDVDFLNKVRCHPKAELYEINSENRDELYEKLLPIIKRWNEE